MLLCGDGEGLLDNAAVPLSARERCEKDSTIGVVQLGEADIRSGAAGTTTNTTRKCGSVCASSSVHYHVPLSLTSLGR